MRCEDCVHEKLCEGYSNCEEVGLCEPKRPHGEWIPQDEYEAYNKCSNCGIVIDNDFPIWRNFCPNCGADMRGESDGK